MQNAQDQAPSGELPRLIRSVRTLGPCLQEYAGHSQNAQAQATRGELRRQVWSLLHPVFIPQQTNDMDMMKVPMFAMAGICALGSQGELLFFPLHAQQSPISTGQPPKTARLDTATENRKA